MMNTDENENVTPSNEGENEAANTDAHSNYKPSGEEKKEEEDKPAERRGFRRCNSHSLFTGTF